MSKRESNSGRMQCRLKGDDAVTGASDAARAFGAARCLAEDDCARLCIIIEELVANLYEHGGLSNEDEVELAVAHEPGGIRITIVDRGQPFDPRSAAPKQERPERGGGVGIDIIRSWARVIDYRVTPKGNCLELILAL